MKRRNIEAGKPPRRPVKRAGKFAEGVCGSSFVYIKFILIWFFILMADFILEFRFEYMWPFWLLIQSVHDTFKYQGLAYSVFFVCIAITSDTVCLLFIPIQWLFFMASTYVWIHYVWHTDKGICIPTVSLWLFFMYIEATMRLRDLKNSPFHIDLCRPFAAHCIGHPVVTLGIGFKSYVSYRFKLRMQREVQKENVFFYELLRQALPKEQPNHTLSVTDKEKSETSTTSNGVLPNHLNKKPHDRSKIPAIQDSTLQIAEINSSNHKSSGAASGTPTVTRKSGHTNKSEPTPVITTSPTPETDLKRRSSARDKKTTDLSHSPTQKTTKTNSGNSSPKSLKHNSSSRSSSTHSNDSEKPKQPSLPNGHAVMKEPIMLPLTNGHAVQEKGNETKIELICTPSAIERLETTIAKLQAELAQARKNDSELNNRINLLTNLERAAKNDIIQLKKENDMMQTKMNGMMSSKQKEKQSMQSMEKRLKSEADSRVNAEKLLQEEKRRKREEEDTAKQAAAQAITSRERERAEVLKQAKQDLELEIQRLETKLRIKEEECAALKKEIVDYQVQEKSVKESETLMSALQAMQDKNLMLENSLSAETRLKLDLFSALGDVKRQLELAHGAIYKRDAEIVDLKSRLADILSILPESRIRSPTPHYSANFLEKPPLVRLSPTQEYPNNFCTQVQQARPTISAVVQSHPNNMEPQMLLHPVHLDPNAAMYTPSTTGL
uniref:Macoilin n=1 Tax=Ciona savignyi TaxID=51511 RepID=Q2TLX9_CIOSA|nr:macoilin [Ciona savignyi]